VPRKLAPASHGPGQSRSAIPRGAKPVDRGDRSCAKTRQRLECPHLAARSVRARTSTATSRCRSGPWALRSPTRLQASTLWESSSARSTASHRPIPAPARKARPALTDRAAHDPVPIANFSEDLRPSDSLASRCHHVGLTAKQVQIHRAMVRGVEKSTADAMKAREATLNSRSLGASLRRRPHT